MRLWNKATGALKDRYSIWVAKLSPYGPCRNPELETVVIKATSHNEQCMDYKNVQRVFQWLRTSPIYLKPLLVALSLRMEKTRSWVVALKGLMLIHGIFCFDLPMVQRMGRLPFDLSHFSDGHVSPEKGWVFNAFVRSYFKYLDQKSAYVMLQAKKKTKRGKETEETLIEELKNLEMLQGMIDKLLMIKPRSAEMNVVLILEAMDCVMDEMLEVYGKFCKEIHRVLLRVCDIGGKEEACMALDIIRKAEGQGDKLCLYFDFCRDIGVLNFSGCPKIVSVSEKDIAELKRIKKGENNVVVGNEEKAIVENEEKAIVVRDNSCREITLVCEKNQLTTVITQEWEVFEDHAYSNAINLIDFTNNPFVDSYGIGLELVPYTPIYNQEIPDLISL